jgi:hypothetical protein
MHNGSEKDLEAGIDLYNKGGRVKDANLDPLVLPLSLTKKEKEALVSFMKRAMTSTNPEVSGVKPPSVSDLPK